MHMPTIIHTKCALKSTVVDLYAESAGKDNLIVELYQQPGIHIHMFSVQFLCLNLFSLTDIQCDMYSFHFGNVRLSPQLEVYKNPLYTESIQQVLFPSASIRKLELWKGYYLRWNPRMRPQVCTYIAGMEYECMS